MNGTELGTQFDFSYASGITDEQILGFEMAGQVWSQYLTDDVTINIHIEMSDQLPENVIGGALPGTKKDIKYEQLWKEMSQDITSVDDSTAFNNLSSAEKKFSALVNGQEIDKVEKMKLTNANSKALNFLDGDRDKLDGYILMSDLSGQTSVQWNYDPLRSEENADNSLDFLSVALHEVGHVLGFASGVDDDGWLNVVTEAREKNQNIKNNAMKFSTPLDLFRYSAEGRIDLSVGQDAFFSIDGGLTNLGNFSTGEYENLGGDGYQASHWKHDGKNVMGIMDPVLKLGVRREISSLDVVAMDVMGWDVVNPRQLDWQEMYSKAIDNAEEAWIGDRQKDIKKMIKESETYHGRWGSRSRGSWGSWQKGLWQHIKFQTLDVSVEVQPPVSLGQVFMVVDNFLNVQRQIPVAQSNDPDLSSNDNKPFEIVVTPEIVTLQNTQETTTEEAKILDIAELGSLTNKNIEDFGSLNDDLVMPIA